MCPQIGEQETKVCVSDQKVEKESYKRIPMQLSADLYQNPVAQTCIVICFI